MLSEYFGLKMGREEREMVKKLQLQEKEAYCLYNKIFKDEIGDIELPKPAQML